MKFAALRIDRLVIAGWTGRDPVAREHHIAELEALGIARPPTVPVYYRVAASRLTSAGRIEVSGDGSSGEAEPVLVRHGGRTFLGVGSDHTDRVVERYGITVSKQMCDKPVGPELWPLEEVAAHWDRLVLRSTATIGGERVLYQEGTLAALMAPDDIFRLMPGGPELVDGTALFCGTLPAIGGIRPAERFEMELADPVLGRALRHGYDVAVLPIAG